MFMVTAKTVAAVGGRHAALTPRLSVLWWCASHSAPESIHAGVVASGPCSSPWPQRPCACSNCFPALSNNPAGVVASGPPPPSDPVFIAIDEKISCVLNKDGGCENCEVQGTMSLQVGREDRGFCPGFASWHAA